MDIFVGVVILVLLSHLQETQPSRDGAAADIRKSFEAGGTILWGIDFDDGDSDMSGLTPIGEDDTVSAYQSPGDRVSYLDATSIDTAMSASPRIRRRQSEFRTTLLKHKQLWQKAAKHANLNASLKGRRKSILPIENITDDTSFADPLDVAEEEEEEEEGPVTQHRFSIFSVKPVGDLLQPPPAHTHSRVSPLTSLDIERNVKPQLRPSYSVAGFLFPRLPTEFTTGVNESLYKRYYSGKKKTAMFVLNVFYILLLIALWIITIVPLPMEGEDANVSFVVRETIVTLILTALHIIVCVLVRKSNSEVDIRRCAILTWSLLLAETLKAPIASYIDHNSLTMVSLPWNLTGTWETALTLFVTFHFLSVIPLRLSMALSATVVLAHMVLLAILNGLYDTSCITRVSAQITTQVLLRDTRVLKHGQSLQYCLFQMSRPQMRSGN